MKNKINHKAIVDSLPKSGDGYPIAPKMKMYFTGSHDSFMGPHQVEILGTDFNGEYTTVHVKFTDGKSYWTDTNTVRRDEP